MTFMDLQAALALSPGERRAKCRELFPNEMRGAVGVMVTKDQAIALLTGQRPAKDIQTEVLAGIGKQPGTGPTVTILPRPTPPGTDIGKLVTEAVTLALAEAERGYIDTQEKMAVALADREAALQEAAEEITKLRRRRQAPASPTVVPTTQGQTVNLLGKDYTAIGGSQFIPALDQRFKPEAMRCQVKAGPHVYGVTASSLIDAVYRGRTILMHGPRGSGKTEWVRWTAAKLGWPLVRVQGNRDMGVDDFVGCMQAANGATMFVPGPLLVAMEVGAILLVDEVDRFPAETTNILHGVLENNATGQLTVTADGGRLVSPHPNFRVVANGNSAGFGDDSGLHPDARLQDAAFLDRFTLSVPVAYMLPEHEKEVLIDKTGIDDATAELMVKFANDTREAQAQGQLMYSTSTRGLLAWATEAEPLGLPVAFAATVLSKCPASDQTIISEIAQRHFGTKLQPEAAAVDPNVLVGGAEE